MRLPCPESFREIPHPCHSSPHTHSHYAVCECDICRSARPQACLCVWHSCTCARECVCAWLICKGAYHPNVCALLKKNKQTKKQYAHKHTITVACTHTQASSEVSGDHATYLHSCFKETVYKAVVDGDLARCSRFFGHFLFCFVSSLEVGYEEEGAQAWETKTKVREKCLVNK